MHYHLSYIGSIENLKKTFVINWKNKIIVSIVYTFIMVNKYIILNVNMLKFCS